MFNKCPGQDNRFIGLELIKCPSCGYELEIFSDEFRARCPNCKGLTYKERLSSCLNWCSSARECIGERKWKQLKGGI